MLSFRKVSALEDYSAIIKRKDDELVGGVRFWEDFLSDRGELVLGRPMSETNISSCATTGYGL